MIWDALVDAAMSEYQTHASRAQTPPKAFPQRSSSNAMDLVSPSFSFGSPSDKGFSSWSH